VVDRHISDCLTEKIVPHWHTTYHILPSANHRAFHTSN